MDEEVTKIVLVGLTKAEFIGYSIWALAGWLLSFAIGVGKGVKKSDAGWSWSKFWRGMWRVVGGFISVAAGVIFFEKLAGFMLESETPIQLTAWSAFVVVGLGSDRLGKVFESFMQKKVLSK